MKLDMDLVRNLLLEIEKNEDSKVENVDSLELVNVENKVKTYHLIKMEEANLVKYYCIEGNTEGKILLDIELTFEGHEFIGPIREESNWQKTKLYIKEKGKPLTILIVKTMIPIIAAKYL